MKIIVLIIIILLICCYQSKEFFRNRVDHVIDYNTKKYLYRHSNPKTCPPPYNQEYNYPYYDLNSKQHKCLFKRSNIIYESPHSCCDFSKLSNDTYKDKCSDLTIDLQTCRFNAPPNAKNCGFCGDVDGNGTYMLGTPEGPNQLKGTNCIPSKHNTKNAWFMCHENPYV